MNIVSTNLARPDTKMETAVRIFLETPAADKRKQCIERFKTELEMEESTAGTYYYLCERKVLEAQQVETEKAIASSKARKFSAVKLQRGSDVASHVHVFLTRKGAEEFNDTMHGFDHIVTGVQKVGKPVAA